MSTTTLRLPGDGDVDLLVEVLRVSADTRRRAATAAAVELADLERERGADAARSPALRVSRLLASAGRLEEIATELEAGRLRIVGVSKRGLTAIVPEGTAPLDDVPPAPGRKLAAVPPPTDNPKDAAIAPPGALGPGDPSQPPTDNPKDAAMREPDEAEVDAATADAEAILDQAFPGETILGETDPVPTAVDDAPLPAGQGNDDDPDPSVDVALLPGFDAEADTGAPR